MPAGSPQPRPVVLVCGEDEFTIKKRARQQFQEWTRDIGGFDQEIIDASAGNSSEALRALSRLREAIQTLPFFGSTKVVWFQNCNFLGDERTATSQKVGEVLADLANEWKTFSWEGVRLLISAGKTDKRRAFYKTLEKIGVVESLAGWSWDDADWIAQAESWVLKELKGLHKEISDEALAELITLVGPHPRSLANELEKLALFSGDRPRLEVGDVQSIVTRQKQARAFALADALGDRDLPRALRALDEELWELKLDSQKSALGLLYGLIAKVRTLLFLQELLRTRQLKAESDYTRFKAQLDRLPKDWLPEDKRLNPLAAHPYVLFKAIPQAHRFTADELVGALARLLEGNRRLVSSGSDEGLVLQQVLVQILSPAGAPADLTPGRAA